MASAKAGVHVLQLKRIAVPDLIRDGYKFIKWDDESAIGTPVTLKVDINGFYLSWTDQNLETEFLEVSSIRDTRSGRGARLPREGKLRDSVSSMGGDIPLEDKTMTIVYGSDFVNVNYINFCCDKKEIAELWAEQLLKMATNPMATNGSGHIFMIKSYTKLCLMSDSKGNIPVKSILKMFAANKDDKKRIDKALDSCGLPSGKNDVISPNLLTPDTFMNFRKSLSPRPEVDQIFHQLIGHEAPHPHSHSSGLSASSAMSSVVSSIGSSILSKQTHKHHSNHASKTMTVDQLVDFLNKEQRDPRRNEILYPYADRAKGVEIIQSYEPSASNRKADCLSSDGFLRFLLSDECSIVDFEKVDLNCDMDQPMNHYFINSSHNTYLSGHQLTGKSSVEIYRQALLAGCRCVELDCWNGRNSDEEPIITHGYTVVTEIVLKDVLEAIADSAFKTSDFPVILSFENHCSPRQQAKIAHYCRKIFGDMLLTETLQTHPLKPGKPLPSPKQLMRKIIIKNKKKHNNKRKRNTRSPGTGTGAMVALSQGSKDSEFPFSPSALATSTPEKRSFGLNNNNITASDTESGVASSSTQSQGLEREDSTQMGDSDDCPSISVSHVKPSLTGRPHLGHGVIGHASCDIEDVDTESSADEEDITIPETAPGIVQADEPSLDGSTVESTAHIEETRAGAEMSALVLYIQPVRFKTFELAEKKDRSYEISSFVETQATSLLKERPVDFVNFNKRQLSRIYPKGTRVDSSNYMPQVFWNAGCQLVALNFQTLDLGMQLNLGIFEYNGRSGYVLKPEFMRRADRLKFDPFTESTVDGIIAGTVAVKIISGQFLSDKRTGTFVEVDMFGLPADTVRRRRTKTVPNNGMNPVYKDETFIFKKVVLPELACLRFTAYEESGKFVGHRIVPVVGLRPGYRHIGLRNESGQPLMLPSLFVHITVKDYVPEEFSDIADALANPIAYQSMAEKRAKQLEALIDDSELPANKDLKGGSTSCNVQSSSQSGAGTKVVVCPDTPLHRESSPTSYTSSSTPTGNRIKMGSDQINRSFSLDPQGAGTSTGGASSSSYDAAASSSSHSHPHHPHHHPPLAHHHQGGSSSTTQTARQSITTSSSTSPSPAHPPLLRQETFSMKINQSVRSLSDDTSTDRIPSLLESDEAHLIAEPLDRIKEHRIIQKIVSKMEKELTTLQKKHEKLRDCRVQSFQQKEGKLMQASKPRSALAKAHSKFLGKKSSSSGPTDSVEASPSESLTMPSSLPTVPASPLVPANLIAHKEFVFVPPVSAAPQSSCDAFPSSLIPERCSSISCSPPLALMMETESCAMNEPHEHTVPHSDPSTSISSNINNPHKTANLSHQEIPLANPGSPLPAVCPSTPSSTISPTQTSIPSSSSPSPSCTTSDVPANMPHASASPSSSSSHSSRLRRQSLQFLVATVPSLHRTLLKRRSDLDLKHSMQDQQQKLDDLYRSNLDVMMQLIEDQIREQKQKSDKFLDEKYVNLNKLVGMSQTSQMTILQELHDQEVASLMKRLETQNKEDLTTIGKKHKDKNELARIKRELQQRLIEQAVCERQRFSSLLAKRQGELSSQHAEVRVRLENEEERERETNTTMFEGLKNRLKEEYASKAPSPS